MTAVSRKKEIIIERIRKFLRKNLLINGWLKATWVRALVLPKWKMSNLKKNTLIALEWSCSVGVVCLILTSTWLHRWKLKNGSGNWCMSEKGDVFKAYWSWLCYAEVKGTWLGIWECRLDQKMSQKKNQRMLLVFYWFYDTWGPMAENASSSLAVLVRCVVNELHAYFIAELRCATACWMGRFHWLVMAHKPLSDLLYSSTVQSELIIECCNGERPLSPRVGSRSFKHKFDHSFLR